MFKNIENAKRCSFISAIRKGFLSLSSFATACSLYQPTHFDGKFEIVGVNGVIHMGKIASGISSGLRIAQGGHVSTCNEALSISYMYNEKISKWHHLWNQNCTYNRSYKQIL